METQNYYGPNPTTDLFTEQPLIKANFGERFGAVLIDGIILLVPNYVIGLALGEGLGNVATIVLAWLYCALQESGPAQATFGKKALGLKVVSTNGEKMSFGQATGRHFGKFISAVILGIGYFMMLWDENKQTLHDKMANAYVAKR